MNNEETMFEAWFQLQRRESFNQIKDYGRLEDHPHWGEGAYNDMKKAWLARALLHEAKP